MTDNIIFLDFDGVLIGDDRRSKFPVRHLDPENVRILADLARDSDSAIVLSTAWRHVEGLTPEILAVLQRDGLEEYWRVIGQTPRVYGGTRGDEIAAWLRFAERYHITVKNICILDDDDDMGHLSPFLVQTDPKLGLTAKDAARALKILMA